MERQRVAVVDRSPTVRQTVAIVLREYEVLAWSPEEFAQLSAPCAADLVLAEQGVVDDAVLATKAPGVPVLWLRSQPAEPAGSAVVLTTAYGAAELRNKVRTLLALRRAQSRGLAIGGFPPPLLPTGLLPLVLSVARSTLPACITGEPGTGRSRLARALHVASGGGDFLAVAAPQCGPDLEREITARRTGRWTLYVDGIETLSPAAQDWLLHLIESAQPGKEATFPRILCGTSLERDELAQRAVLRPELFYALTAVILRLPPLRERRQDIPEIVRFVARRLAEESSLPPAAFTEAALERLQNYLWFGNLAELEAVLARTLTTVSRRPIDADDLCFGYEPGPLTCKDETQTTVHDPFPLADTTHQIEVLVNELAHEIRNPLVTIKTISQHLERLLESASGREEVVQLAGEAVQKIDSVFENLLRYSRFREPKKEETTVNAIVAQVLSELAPLLSERRIVLNYRPPDPLPVFADREQLGFALVNLLEALVRDLEDQTTLTIEPVPGAPALRIEVPRVPGYLSQRLSALIEENVPAEAVEPLGLLIARSLFRRNGGRVQVQPNREGSRAAIIIEFPGSVGTRDNYGQAKSVDRG